MPTVAFIVAVSHSSTAVSIQVMSLKTALTCKFISCNLITIWINSVLDMLFRKLTIPTFIQTPPMMGNRQSNGPVKGSGGTCNAWVALV